MPDWQEIHSRNGFSIITLVLAPLSLVYGFAVRLRLLLFRIRRRHSLPGFVISLGNITTGGTGKTPAACMLAEWALNEGYKVAILSRGYGGRHKKGILEVSDGIDIMARPEESGDEPFLMAKRLKGVPILVAKNRYYAGIFAHKKLGSDFFILDDGFQHLTLNRDLDLLLLDYSNPFGNKHMLPWGPLREPIKQIRRAGGIIFTRSEGKSGESNLENQIISAQKDTPVFHGRHSPVSVVFPGQDSIFETAFLQNKRIVGFAGIARPQALRKTLIRLGADVIFFKEFMDHHVYSPGELKELRDQYVLLNGDFLITTEKDWARMPKEWFKSKEAGFLRIDFIISKESDLFYNLLKEKIEIKQ